jgi:hypothetical protein
MRPEAVAGPRCRIRSACALQAWAAAGPAGRHPSQSLDTVPRAWLSSGGRELGAVSAGREVSAAVTAPSGTTNARLRLAAPTLGPSASGPSYDVRQATQGNTENDDVTRRACQVSL